MRQCVAETHPKRRRNGDDLENGDPGAPHFPLVAPSAKSFPALKSNRSSVNCAGGCFADTSLTFSWLVPDLPLRAPSAFCGSPTSCRCPFRCRCRPRCRSRCRGPRRCPDRTGPRAPLTASRLSWSSARELPSASEVWEASRGSSVSRSHGSRVTAVPPESPAWPAAGPGVSRIEQGRPASPAQACWTRSSGSARPPEAVKPRAAVRLRSAEPNQYHRCCLRRTSAVPMQACPESATATAQAPQFSLPQGT